jgi:hypothetical protein
MSKSTDQSTAFDGQVNPTHVACSSKHVVRYARPCVRQSTQGLETAQKPPKHPTTLPCIDSILRIRQLIFWADVRDFEATDGQKERHFHR